MTPLLDLLSDENGKVRFQAAQALVDLGWKPSDDAQKARHSVALQDFSSTISCGDAAVDPLLLLLRDEDPALRLAALETISQIKSSRVFSPIINILKDENPHVRAVAVQALSRIGNPEALEPLSKLVRDSSWEVRSVLLDAFEHFDSSRAVDGLMILIRDETPDIRSRAAEILGKKGDLRAITALVIALVDEDFAVRTIAEQSLQNLDANWQKTEYAKGATSGLLPALKHRSEVICEKAADVLRAIGQTRAMNSFLTAETGITPNSAVPILANALKSHNRDLRQAAAEAFGRFGDQNAVEYLVEALMDEDQYVREAALYALNLLNWKPANDAEVVRKAVILQRWETAVLFDTLAFEPLILVLNSDNPETCTAAIEALGKIGDKRAIEPLVIMLQHPTKVVRTAAAIALRTLGWLPKDARESVRQAIELEDWMTVAQHGAASVEPLVALIKEQFENDSLREAASSALAGITDSHAVKSLIGYTRDGQIAEVVVRALTALIDANPGEMAEDDLRAITNVSNIFQFRYNFDVRYGKLVRAGLQEVDTSKLKKLAMQELARRGV